ncbi:MAG: T9SS type A sorting domain-containing protein [Bacteroidales bacterium]|nr:T9SS type A sorting domain-containing protein [Bacteroidales bacterium]
MNIFKLSTFLISLLISLSATAQGTQNTYYFAETEGVWGESDSWTTSEGGSFHNDGNVVPGVASTGGSATDRVVVLAGRTVTYNLTQDLVLDELVVKGTLIFTSDYNYTITVNSLSGEGEIVYAKENNIIATTNTFTGVSAFTCSLNITDKTYGGGVRFSGNGVVARLKDNVTVNGNLVVENGATITSNTGNTGSYTLTVNGNLTVEQNSTITSVSNQESYVSVAGDITNNGSLIFASGTKPTYSQNNTTLSNRVVLSMIGNQDAVFTQNGTANLFKFVCEKSNMATAEVNGSINMLGRTANLSSYTDLPWVPKSGVLKLGSGLTISAWGTNQSVQSSGYAEDEPTANSATMYIPEGAKVLIAGANVNVGSETYSNNRTLKGNVLVAGELEVMGGELILAEGSWGILAVEPFEGTPTQAASRITISGGVVKAPRIVSWTKNNKSRGLVYEQTGGEVSIDVTPNTRWVNSHSNKDFFLGDDSKFLMSGGTFTMAVQHGTTAYKGITGMWLAKNDYTPIESVVSGGTIVFKSNKLTDFSFFAPDVNFYNITISGGAKVSSLRPDNMRYNGAVVNGIPVVADVHVLKNLTINGNSTLSCGKSGNLFDELYVGGNFSVVSDCTLTLGSDKNVYLDGANNGTFSSAVNIPNLYLKKTKATAKVTIASGTPMKIVGTVYANLGQVAGPIQLCGTAQQTIEDKCLAFAEADLTINNSKGVKLLSNTEFKSVTFSTNALFTLQEFNLKVNTDLATSGWGTSRMFVTDNSTSAGGLTVPATSGKILPVGTNGMYGPITIKYTSAGDFVTGAAVYGQNPNLDDGVNFYWVIYSTRADYGDGNNTNTYSCRIPNSNNISIPGNLLGLHCYACGSQYVWDSGLVSVRKNSDVAFRSVASGMYMIGSGLLATWWNTESKVYQTTKSGNWKDQLWSDGSTTHIGGHISLDDKVVIKSGHTITINSTVTLYHYRDVILFGGWVSDGTGAARAGTIEVEAGGKLIIEVNENYDISNMDISRFAGEGTIEYKYVKSTQAPEVYKPTTKSVYTDFCSNDKATFIYNMVNNNIISVYNFNSFLTEYPNLKITSNAATKSFTIQCPGNKEIKVNGNLELERGNFVYNFDGGNCGSLSVAKDVVCAAGSVFGTTGNNEGTFSIGGNIINNGTMSLSSVTMLSGGITNNGVLTTTGNNLFYFCGGMLNDAVSNVSGSATAGRTNIQNIVICRDLANRAVKFDIPVGDANGNCSIHLLRGELRIATASPMILKDFSSEKTWQSCVDDLEYMGKKSTAAKDVFDIPAEAKLQVLNNANVAIATSGNDGRVRLAGALTVEKGSFTVNNGNTLSAIGYEQGSKMQVGNGGVLTVSQFAPYESDADITVTMNENAIVNINSGKVFGIFGVLDFRMGSVTTKRNSVFNINNVATSTSANASLYYCPRSSSLHAESAINIADNLGTFKVNASQALSKVSIGTGTTVSMLSDVAIKGDLVDNGTLRAEGYDLTLGGHATFNGSYISGVNTTHFNGTKTQNVTSSSPLNLSSVELSGQNVTFFNDAVCNADFTMTNGKMFLKDNVTFTVKGSYHEEADCEVNGTNGKVLLTNASESQSLYCEGSIRNLSIDNAHGVTSSAQQALPITILGELDLINGQFSIGGNQLLLETTAEVVTSNPNGFGLERMIATYSSEPDRGVRVNFKAGDAARTFVLPIGNANKYAPVRFVSVKASNGVGSIVVAGVSEVYPAIKAYSNYAGNALKYYWSVSSTDVNVSQGKLEFYANRADAIGYPSDEYRGAFLNMSTGLWDKSLQDILVTGDDFLVMTYDIKGSYSKYSGIYTAGIKNELPDQVLTFISDHTGNWSDNTVWYVYDLSTKTKTDVQKTADQSFNGCGIVIDDNTTVTMGETDKKLDLCFVEIKENGVLDANNSSRNNAGYVRGTGKLVVRTANAMPAGNYEEFFSENGGTVEYAGTTDYQVFVYQANHNNVIFSGTGSRKLRSDVDVAALGTVTLRDGVNVTTYEGHKFTIAKDLIVENGKFTNKGVVSFNGVETQTIKGAASSVTFAGLELHTNTSVVSEIDIVTSNLNLQNGVLSIDEDHSIRISSTATDAISGGSKNSYVDGRLIRNIGGSSAYKYPVGNSGRYALTELSSASAKGDYEVRYFNTQCTEYTLPPTANDEVESIGNEYWAVKGTSSTATARLKMRWDESSGGIDKNTSVASYNGGWKLVSWNSYNGNTSNGTLITLAEKMRYNNGYRYFAFGVSQLPSGVHWLGAINSYWDEEDNWSDGKVPNRYSTVSIPAGTPNSLVINSIANVKVMSIEQGATVTLEGASGVLTVADDGQIANEGQFVINYHYDAMPSFIHKAYSGNDVVVNRTFIQNRIYYVGSAVDNSNIEGMSSMDRLQHYDGEQFVIKDPLAGFAGGYGVAATIGLTHDMMTQRGKLMTKSAKTITIANEWSWVANPYPYTLDSKTAFKNTKAEQLAEHGVDPTIWMRIREKGETAFTWATFNIATGVSTNGNANNIAPFQAVCLKVSDQDKDRKITWSGTPSASTTTLKSAEIVDESDVLRLTIVGDQSPRDEMAFVFRDGGQTAYFYGDSEKKLEVKAERSAIGAVKDGDKVVAIAYYPKASEVEDVEMPLYMWKGTANKSVSIEANNIDVFNTADDVYLIDNLTGETVSLRDNPVYDVPLSDNIAAGRFAIKLSNAVVEDPINNGGNATAIEEQPVVTDIKVFATGNTVIIRSNAAESGVAKIYDISGHMIMQQPIKTDRTEILMPESGIYMVEAVRGASKSTEKVIIE